MFEFKLRIAVDGEPSEAVKAKLLAEAESFAREAAPGIELTRCQGAGSWWLELSGSAATLAWWLVAAIGSWGVKHGLDHAVKKLRESDPPRGINRADEPGPHDETQAASAHAGSMEGGGNPGEGRPSIDAAVIEMSRLLEILKRECPGERTVVQVYIHDSLSQRGGVIRLASDAKTATSLNVHISDSKDDLTSYFRSL